MLGGPISGICVPPDVPGLADRKEPSAKESVSVLGDGSLRKRKVWAVPPKGQASPSLQAQAGHVYFRAPDWRQGDGRSLEEAYEAEFETNLNCEVVFKDSKEKIECRHLVLAVAQARMAYLEKKKGGEAVGRFSYADFSVSDKLQATVGPWTEPLYDLISSQSPNPQLVLLSEWGRFLENQFKDLQPGAHRHLLVTSSNHAMLLELQVKQEKGGEPYRVAMFYDPNQTVTHQRVVLDTSTTRNCQIHDFLADEDLEEYFPEVLSERMACVIPLDPSHLRAPEQALKDLMSGDRKSRSLDISHVGVHCTTTELTLRLQVGAVEGLPTRLTQTLAQSDAGQALALLRFELPDKTSLLHWALLEGHVEVVAALVAKLVDPGVGLAHQERLKLMLARDARGVPGLLMAITKQHKEAARVLLDAILGAQSGISKEDLQKFLVVEGGSLGTSMVLVKYLGTPDPAEALRKLLLLPASLLPS
jgi:hypothetical protein